MPARPWRAGAWPRPDARWPVFLMAALAILAAVKLGLLANDMLDLAPPGAAPAVESTLAPARAAPTAGLAAESEPQGPMPAAGPDAPAPAPAGDPALEPAAAASTAEAPAPAAGVPADPAPAPPPPEFDPSRLTAAEIAVLQQLAGRRTALDQRARELDRRQALLETAAAALEGQIARLGALRDQIVSAVEQHDAAEETRLKSLVKIYETMKAKAAAEIFDRLEMAILIRVVERMREPKSADVLARMDPVKARQVTIELARRTKLLEAAGGPTAAAGPPPNGG
jgi:flagellar motility protein MotE (MotC chaperone)